MADAEESISLEYGGRAIFWSFVAGAFTWLGAAVVFFPQVVQLVNKRVLAAGLGFSSGVMVYVSLTDIFGKALGAFEEAGHSESSSYHCTTICIFAGMAVFRIIDFLVHRIDPGMASRSLPPTGADAEAQAADPAKAEEDVKAASKPTDADAEAQAADPAKAEEDVKAASKQLHLLGLATAIAIALHNFPEGMAVFVGTLADPDVGVVLAFGIGCHNLPEGLCVALPIYYATGSRLKGFLYAFLSGIVEPIGAAIVYGIIKGSGSDVDQLFYAILFGLVGGMMIMIVIQELLPTAYKFDPEDRCTSLSVVAGMGLMAASLMFINA